MTTEGIFDFFRGDRTISITSTEPVESETNLKNDKNEIWSLYTLNPELTNCPLDCIIIYNYFKYVKTETVKTVKIVNCTSCSPNGILPILVAQSNGHVLEIEEIIEKFFKIGNLYIAIDGLIGGYIRSNSTRNKNMRAADVTELIEALPSASLDPATTVLLFSMIQGAKMHLKHDDPIRGKMERSEFLSELFINLLEML